MRNFSQYNFVLPLLSFILFVLLQACQSNNTNLVIAKIGNTEIHQSDFKDRYENYLIQTGIKDNLPRRKDVLNSMITEIVLTNYDDNSKILENKEYQKELEWTKKEAVLSFLKDREIYAKIKVTDQDLRNAFLRSNQKIAARHLFSKSEEEINNLYEFLKAGADFNTLAKQTFTDSTLKNNGGYLGYFSWGDMDPAFEEKAYSMKVGEISEPVKTENGYSIIKVEDKVTRPIITENEFQQKKSKLAQVLRINKKKPAEREYINKVIDLDSVKFVDKEIDKIWKNIQLKVIEKKEIAENLDGTTAVRYKDKSYSTFEIEKQLNQLPEFHLKKIKSEEKLKTVIKGLLLQERLLQIANKEGYEENKSVISKLKKMDTDLFMRFKISEIMKNASIDDSLAYNFYKENPNFFSTHEMVNVQEILVDDLNLAKSLIKQLKNGKDFGQLSEKYSLRKSTAKNKGIIGLAPVEKFGNLKDLVKNSKLNTVLGPIKIEDIYGIFKILERDKSKPVDYKDSKEVAVNAVKFKLKNEIIQNYVSNLEKNIKVDIDLKTLGSTKILM